MKTVKRHDQPGQQSFADLPDILTAEDVWNFLRLGRNGVYDLLKSGRLRSVRVGQKIRVTKAALRDFLSGDIE